MDLCCLQLKIKYRSSATGVIGVTSFVTIDEQLQWNRVGYFPHAGYGFWSRIFR